jgi:hypothetical protein
VLRDMTEQGIPAAMIIQIPGEMKRGNRFRIEVE